MNAQFGAGDPVGRDDEVAAIRLDLEPATSRSE